jgi:DNA helicase-2/ATP-dependent DNA helicase PcrA
MEEEIRLFYVAITRAKTHLELISCEKSNNSKLPVSRFFKKLKKLQSDIYIKNLANEINLNKKLIHTKFGEGIIKSLDKKSGISEIEFDNIGTKKLSIFSCLEDGIIQIKQ